MYILDVNATTQINSFEFGDDYLSRNTPISLYVRDTYHLKSLFTVRSTIIKGTYLVIKASPSPASALTINRIH